MANKINEVPPKRSETETPTAVDEHGDRHPSAEEKLRRSANRTAHKAAKTEQNSDEGHNELTNNGPH